MPKFFKTAAIVPIVGDGAIGHPDLADGRLMPVLILDCAAHKPLEDLILVHKDTPPGDVTTRWGWKPLNKKKVFLTFFFHRPVETSATIEFDVAKYGGVVDWIMNVRGVYLQPLSSGATVSTGVGRPKIIVEVPTASTFPGWKDIYLRSLEKQYVARGLSKTQARTSANDHVVRLREIQRPRA